MTGTSVFAATPSITTHTLTQSDPQVLFNTDVIEHLHTVMKPGDVDIFLDAVSSQYQSATLWDMMVDLFGYKQGNIYTNNLMDVRWRVSDMDGHSVVFSAALANNVPAVATDM